MMNVIFDIGGVLLQYDPRELLKKYFPEQEEVLLKIIFQSDDWKTLDLGEHTNEELRDLLIPKYPQYAPAIRFIFDHWINETLKPMPATFAVVKELKKAGYPIYILSNIHQDIYKIRADAFPEVFDLFNGRVLSGEEHLIKPDPRIYQVLFKRYHLDSNDCLFIDDNQVNIDEAKKLGMDGIVMRKDLDLMNALRAKGFILP